MLHTARYAPRGLVYHALNRAVARLPLFEKQGDCQALERVMDETQEKHPTRILARCLMPNYWHTHLGEVIMLTTKGSICCAKGIEAADAQLDPKSAWLSTETRPLSQTEILRWKRESISEHLVFGQLQRDGNSLQLRLMTMRRDRTGPLAVRSLRLAADDIALAGNVPELNQKVIKYLRDRVGTTIGSGQCWTPAAEALKQAGAKRTGIYIMGRELADHEALVPGDILQLEQARFQSADGKRRASMTHHTAIVDEVVQPNAIRIIHQNFGQGEKRKTLTTFTLHLDELRSGTLIPYRPADETTPLPWRISPRRRSPARVVKDSAGRIDLLKTLDPALDSVRGIWHFWEGPLSGHAETYAKLQIPIDVPTSYVLDAEVTREAGDGSFGFGLVVDGRQVLLTVDAYADKITGLHRLDGKRANANSTTRKGALLPVGTKVQLQVRVTPNSVRLLADRKNVLDWTGDSQRLSADPNWEIPRKDWLFLASYEVKVRVSTFTLTPLAVD